MTSQTKITEDDWQRRCVSAADQSEAGLLQTLRSFRSAPRLLQTVAMDDFFVFQNRQLTANTTSKKIIFYRKLNDRSDIKTSF